MQKSLKKLSARGRRLLGSGHYGNGELRIAKEPAKHIYLFNPMWALAGTVLTNLKLQRHNVLGEPKMLITERAQHSGAAVPDVVFPVP